MRSRRYPWWKDCEALGHVPGQKRHICKFCGKYVSLFTGTWTTFAEFKDWFKGLFNPFAVDR